jgi:hypothetical protein
MNKLEILNRIIPAHIEAVRKSDNNKLIDLSKKHVQDCEVLADRTELLRKLPKERVVAEIGVAEGDYSAKILKYNNPSKLLLIDTWSTERYKEEMYQEVKRRFAKQIDKGKIEIQRKDSIKALEEKNRSLDWVYIDTTHSYERTKKELEHAESAVKENGYIAGHDYSRTNKHVTASYGVVPAVNEFCKEKGWKLKYITLENSINPSFVLERLEE